MFRLCIVGCGITGAVTAMLLKHRIPQLKVVIFEKARGTGGRMSTSRSPFGSSLDLGAQFITQTSVLSESQKKCYSSLLNSGLLQPLEGKIEGLMSTPLTTGHFVCSQGSGAIVKHFLQSADCEVFFGHRVIKISTAAGKWNVICDNDSDHEFDAVVLTLPVPQVLQLEGINSHTDVAHIENMKAVVYCSRFAIGMFYEGESTFFESIPWIAKFIPDDSVLRFCSIDYRKKRTSSSLPTLVVHSTKEFGKAYMDDDDVSTVQKLILDRLEQILPNMPQPSQIKFHKWRYSQVEKSFLEAPGCLVTSKTPLLICGGDGFSHSTFEGCIYSAENIVKNIVENIHM